MRNTQPSRDRATADSLADLITETLQQLTQLIVAENAALTAGRTEDLAEKSQEKNRLTQQYENQLLVMKQQKSSGSWQPGIRQLSALQQAADAFHTALAHHRRLVQAAKSVGERMLAAITRDVAERQAGFNAYGQGNAQMPPSSFRRPPVSLALNQMV